MSTDKRKKRTEKDIDPTSSLQIRTLSGVFETSRAVVRAINIEQCSTYNHLAKELRRLTLPSNRDRLIELFNALERLEQESLILGLTTLIKPSDHPLVIRETIPDKE